MDLELELVADNSSKEKGTGLQTVAKVSVLQISSTPVDQDQKSTTSILTGKKILQKKSNLFYHLFYFKHALMSSNLHCLTFFFVYFFP